MWPQGPTPQSCLKASGSPLNLSLSQAPMPGTVCGCGPAFPSVYCHNVHVGQFGGTTAFGPYCASQKKHCDKIGSLLFPSCCLMRLPEYKPGNLPSVVLT